MKDEVEDSTLDSLAEDSFGINYSLFQVNIKLTSK